MQIIKPIENLVLNNIVGIVVGASMAYAVYNYSYILGLQVVETNPNFQYLFILAGAIIGMIIDESTERKS